MATSKTGDDAGAKEVQATVDAAEDVGFIGTKVDPTPNEAYTVAGVTSGAETPETAEPKHDPNQTYAGDVPLQTKPASKG